MRHENIPFGGTTPLSVPSWGNMEHSFSGLVMTVVLVLMFPILFDELVPHAHTENKHSRHNKAKDKKDHCIRHVVTSLFLKMKKNPLLLLDNISRMVR